MMRDSVKPVFQKPADGYEPHGRLDPAGFDRHVSFSTLFSTKLSQARH